jgi:ABC-2 type transport system permease protein
MDASLAWGVGLGLLARDMQALVDTNPALATFLGASEAPEKAMTAVGATILALAAAAMALQGVGQLVGEEQSGRLAALLATRTSRLNWWASAASVIALEVLAVLVMGGLALGGGTAMAIGDPGAVTSGIVACVAYIPAVLVLGAAGGLLFTVQPAAAHLGWVLLAWSAIVALLGDTLQLPSSVRQLSPLEHVGRVPVQDPQLAASAALSALAVLLVLAGGLALTRRDLRHN